MMVFICNSTKHAFFKRTFENKTHKKQFKLRFSPYYSNNYIGFRSSRGLCSRSLSSHSTCKLSNSHLISTVCWTTTYLHVTCGLKDNISSVFLSGKSAAARRSFCFAAPTIWNSLESSTRDATSIGTFKTRLKTELFNSAFQ